MLVHGKLFRGAAALITGAVVATLLSFTGQAPAAQALTGSQFDPTNIISDSNFYNPNAMSEAEIQSFLQAKIGNCGNGNCLNIKSTPTFSRAGDVMCGAYTGGGSERTSTIIFKVQQACGVSAKVLLVTLQKEQGLVTATSPSDAKLERAMGYACPDSANGGCDAAYAGLYNQIYRAAWQFKRYGNPAGTSNFFTWFPVGRPSAVQYHPNAACGAPVITIQNRATAALYYYTPYQPNAASLANIGSTGDSCSSYGNRNFWVYYNQWFGATTLPAGSPDGQLETVTASRGQINISGWAFDRDVPATPLAIDVQIGSSWFSLTADKNSPVTGTYAGVTDMHGFSGSFPAPQGGQTMCIYVKNQRAGVDLALGCKWVVVPEGTPVGNLDAAIGGSNSVKVTGWAIDTDVLTAPLVLDIQVGSSWFTATANTSNAAAGALYPGAGNNHGFSATVPVAPGSYTACVYAKNQGIGGDFALGCKPVTVVSAPPVGELLSVATVPGGVKLTGWALDTDTLTAPVQVAVQIDSTWAALTANTSYPAAATTYPGAGVNHGFSGTVPTTGGTHTMCVYVNNTGVGTELNLGCRTITVPAPTTGIPPKGELTTAAGVAGGVSLAGWAVDVDALTTPLTLDVQVGSSWASLTADKPSTAAAAAVSGAGPNHGFSGTVPAAPGSYPVCVYAKGAGAGGDLALGCRTLTVLPAVAAGSAPKGALTTVTPGAASVTLAGWAVDADAPTTALVLDVQIGSTWQSLTANTVNAAGEAAVPGSGQNHGFSGSVPAPVGTNTMCVYVKGAGAGGDLGLGCRTITVSAAAPVAPVVGAVPKGALTTVTPVDGGVTLAGWAVDADDPAAALVLDVQIGSTWQVLTANTADPAGETAVPGSGQNHGFSGTVTAPRGAQTMCVYVKGAGAGGDLALGCRTVTIP